MLARHRFCGPGCWEFGCGMRQSAGDARGIPSGAAELTFASLGSDSPRPFTNTPHIPGYVVAVRLSIQHRVSTLCEFWGKGSHTLLSSRSFCLCVEPQPQFPDACGVFLKGRGLSEPSAARALICVPSAKHRAAVQPRKEHPVRVPAASLYRGDVFTQRQAPPKTSFTSHRT